MILNTHTTTTTAIICRDPMEAPRRGNMTCTLGNQVFSVCYFTCFTYRGLTNVSLQTIECLENPLETPDGIWSGEAPECWSRFASVGSAAPPLLRMLVN